MIKWLLQRQKTEKEFFTKTEEFTPEDATYRDDFAGSRACRSVEKSIRNRISSLNVELIEQSTRGNTVQAAKAAGKIEELSDLLLEWKNARADAKENNPHSPQTHDAA